MFGFPVTLRAIKLVKAFALARLVVSLEGVALFIERFLILVRSYFESITPRFEVT